MKKRLKSLSVLLYMAEPELVGYSVLINVISNIANHFETKVFTNQYDFLKLHLPHINVVSVEFIKLKSIPILGFILYWKKIATIINNEESDAVFLYHDSAPVAIWLKAECFQYVVQVHEMLGLGKQSFHRKIILKINRFFIFKGLRKSKANFVVSQPIIQYLESKKIPNLHLVPHGVDVNIFRDPKISKFHSEIIEKKEQGYFIVCYTGWVSEIRGLWLMLESVRISIKKNSKIAFLIAGSDERFSKIIINYFNENCMSENLICLGKIDYEFIPGVIFLSDVCFSFLENNPVYQLSPPQKIIEYFAAGKPVIANKVLSQELLITDGFNGFLVDDNIEDISEKIVTFSTDSAMWKQMCKNASKTVMNNDISIVCGKIVDTMI